jgi:hypothetical protein
VETPQVAMSTTELTTDDPSLQKKKTDVTNERQEGDTNATKFKTASV